MATVPVVQPQVGGALLTATAATAGPDKVKPGSTLLVNNGGGSAITVTIVVPGNTKYGQPEPDVTSVSIPAARMGTIGPLPKDLAGTDGLVAFTCSASASVSLYAIPA
jgi:hypothetical protein